jgi:hypothetical protein
MCIVVTAELTREAIVEPGIRAGRSILLLAVVSAGSIGCGAAESNARGSVVRSDSAGIELVTSPSRDVPLAWRVEREFVRGGEEAGIESYYALWKASVGADARGNVYVLDGNASRVLVYDRRGRLQRSVGSRGGGPGELQAPHSLVVTASGEISVYDYSKGFVRFDASSQPLEEERTGLRPIPLRQRFVMPTQGGTALATMGRHGDGLAYQLRWTASHDTTLLAVTPLPRADMVRYPSCGGGMNLPPLFTPDLVWDATPDHLVVAMSAAYSIDVVRDGRVVRRVRRAIPTIPAIRALAIADLGDGFRINFGRGPCVIPPEEMVDLRGFGPEVPMLRAITVAPDGSLFVERRAPDEPTTYRIDVFDATGAYLGTLPDGTPMPLLVLEDGAIVAVERDADDVERLAVLRVERR